MLDWITFSFQNFITSFGVSLDFLNDYIMFFIAFILISVGGILYFLKKNFHLSLIITDIRILEFLWTVVPAVILVFIGLPSLSAIYGGEDYDKCDLSLKVVGRQWLWNYDYTDLDNVHFSSYLSPVSDLNVGGYRLLETDTHLVWPLNSTMRLIISSADVLHRWALPQIGVKADANPGRVNVIYVEDVVAPGLFFGQCSEICGANHSFMPITTETNSYFDFYRWTLLFETSWWDKDPVDVLRLDPDSYTARYLNLHKEHPYIFWRTYLVGSFSVGFAIGTAIFFGILRPFFGW